MTINEAKQTKNDFDMPKAPKVDESIIMEGSRDLFKKLGKFEEAFVCYNKTLEIDSEDENAWYEKGIVLEKLERYSEALECYDKVLELNSEFEDAIKAKKT